MQPKNNFIVKIQIKNEQGQVIDETEAISFKGLLALAHDDGLKSVKTTIVTLPTEDNKRTAVVQAEVTTARGTYSGTGDASPTNVNRKIAPHVLRMAETRAIARAFRLAVNIGVVAIEELGEDIAIVGSSSQESERRGPPVPRTFRRPVGSSAGAEREGGQEGDGGARGHPERSRGRDTAPTEVAPGDRRAMSDEQRKLLFRLAFDLGETRETVRDRVLRALGVERLEWATRVDASKAIDALKRELAARDNGRGLNGGSPHGPS